MFSDTDNALKLTYDNVELETCSTDGSLPLRERNGKGWPKTFFHIISSQRKK